MKQEMESERLTVKVNGRKCEETRLRVVRPSEKAAELYSKELAGELTHEEMWQQLCDIELSPHFKLGEFILSGTALRRKLDNTPPIECIDALEYLATATLEPLRQRFGVLRVTSGYRSLTVNSAVNGSRNSLHLMGMAADLHVTDTAVAQRMLKYCMEKPVPFDQILIEMRRTSVYCFHISSRCDGRNRRIAIADYKVERD